MLLGLFAETLAVVRRGPQVSVAWVSMTHKSGGFCRVFQRRFVRWTFAGESGVLPMMLEAPCIVCSGP